MRPQRGAVVTTTCCARGCSKTFTYTHLRGPVRKYCDEKCREVAARESTRRSVLRKKGMSVKEIEDLMRHAYARRSIKVHDGSFDAKKTEVSKRRCSYHTDDVSCITVLCRYNPGPYCFVHAQIVSEELLAEHERQRVRESRRIQARMLGALQRNVDRRDRETRRNMQRSEAA